MARSQPTTSLLVVAGERSSDRIAARALRALARRATFDAFGIGGDALAASGVSLLAHEKDLAAIGLRAVAARLPAWSKAWFSLREEIARRKPEAALLVDTPEVNLPLARILKSQGVPVVQYVGPQVWAWRSQRIRLLASRTDHVALVLPFEKALYDAAGVRASFVGHPLLDEPPPLSRVDARRALAVAPDAPLVALLPGSRRGEIERHGPALVEVARRLGASGIACAFVPPPGAAPPVLIDAALRAGCIAPAHSLEARDSLSAADAAIVASGTATLEAALTATPHAVIYRLGRLSSLAARALVRVPYVGLPNWIAGRRAVPELLLDEATPDRIETVARQLLEPDAAMAMRRDLASVRDRLGASGADERVAAILWGILLKSPRNRCPAKR